MGLSVLFVLILTNTLISLIRKIVPDEIRIPVYIVVIALVVTMLEWILQAKFTDLYNSAISHMERKEYFSAIEIATVLVLSKPDNYNFQFPLP